MKLLKSTLLDFLFPPLCHVCRSFIRDADEIHICRICRDRLPLAMSPHCTVCGIPFDGAGGDHVCGSCLLHPPHYDYARAALLHEGVARDMIHAFKYQYKTHLRRPLALLLLEGVAGFVVGQKLDVIIPVPLHRSRLRSRGFNQAVLLGQLLSTRLSLPMLAKGLLRIRQTEPQIKLSGEERKNNVKGAFAVENASSIRGRRVLLLDDVMTTGSTVNECAKELKKAGAAKVVVVTVAHAVR